LGSFSGWKKFDELFFLDIVININRVSRVTVVGGGGWQTDLQSFARLFAPFHFLILLHIFLMSKQKNVEK
jgi:hypothetical protein